MNSLPLGMPLKVLARASSKALKTALVNRFNEKWQRLGTLAQTAAVQNGTDVTVRDAKLIAANRHLQLNWTQDIYAKHAISSHFPYSWLRDNCQCPTCFHPVSRSRTVDWAQCDVTVLPKHVQVSADGQTIIVDWMDAHYSQYSASWLHTRRFERDAQQKWLATYKQRKELWGSATQERFPRTRFDYCSLLQSDKSLLEWMLELERRGVALVEGAGTQDETSVRRLAERVAFIRRTHYGEEFSVKAKTEPSNVAYTGQPLQLHTDLPYYDYKPGVNLLHCLVQSEGRGGENHLVDTLRVAQQIKQSNPQHYKALATTQVDWTDEGQEEGKGFRSLHRAPVICEDWHGEIVRVNYSQPQRDSHFTVPLEQVEPWYLALRHFTRLMLQPDNCVIYKLKPGELLSFDNLRICHGRNGYQPSANEVNERHLVGAYLDWDEIRSRIRVLQQFEDK